MNTAIFGYTASGKTELFMALAGPQSHSTTKATVKIPDNRLQTLADVIRPQKIINSEMQYWDIPGGSTRDKGLGQRMLGAIRPADCLLGVLDNFSGLNDPSQQCTDIETELILADLSVVENRQQRLIQDKKKDKHLVDPNEEQFLAKVQQLLEEQKPLRLSQDLSQNPWSRGFGFLSAKPILYVWNISENLIGTFKPPQNQAGQSHISVCAKLERELAELQDDQEQKQFLEAMGLAEPAPENIISSTFSLLDLITFYTYGPKEVRAWAAAKGTTAIEAAGMIHSDMQKGFIRAEVLGWKEFEIYKDFKKAKEHGLLRLEGKEYQVQDGDIITFRFNV